METRQIIVVVLSLLLAATVLALQVDAAGPACGCQGGICTCPQSIGMQGCTYSGGSCVRQASGVAIPQLGCPGCPGCPDNPDRTPGEPGCYGANYGCPGCPGCPGHNATPANPGEPGCLMAR